MLRVSVIIPLYNCEPYVAAAVRSVLQQSVRDLEVIVVDDGSTDDGVATLAQFGDEVTVIRQANSGVAAARNTGLSAATGEFIAFLDADDWWYPGRLAAQLAAFERYPIAGLVFSDFAYVDQYGEVRQPRGGIRKKYGVVRDAQKTPWSSLFPDSASITYDDGSSVPAKTTAYCGPLAVSLFMGNMINTCSVLMRREAVARCGVFDTSLSTEEDYDFWQRIASDWPLLYVDVPLLVFRQRPGQLTRPDQIERIVRNVARVTESSKRRLGARLPAATAAKRSSTIDRDLGEICLRTGSNSEARHLFWRSLRSQPSCTSTWMFLLLAFLPSRYHGALKSMARSFRGRSNHA